MRADRRIGSGCFSLKLETVTSDSSLDKLPGLKIQAKLVDGRMEIISDRGSIPLTSTNLPTLPPALFRVTLAHVFFVHAREVR